MVSTTFLEIFFVVFCLIHTFSEGKPPILTAKEKAAVDKLREAVGHKITAQYMQSDAYLVKWVKASKNFNADQAIKGLEKTLEWRKSQGIDELPTKIFSPEFTKEYMIDLSFRDRNGAPIGFVPFGEWDIRKKAREGKRSELTQYMHWLEETTAQLSFNLTGDSRSMVFGEMSGFSWSKGACISCIPFFVSWVTDHEMYYPYNYYRMICANAPLVFQPVVAVMKPLMSPSTREAFMVFGSNRAQWTQELAKTIDLDTIPTRFGGTGKYEKGTH